MLENFPLRDTTDELKLQRRVLAVAAALEIAKVSASASGRAHSDKVADDLRYTAENIQNLADAILTAIEK
ncbi:hypothetical protein J1785_21885 [Rahnella sp. SL6]|uniref:hypothetical protein n=1 Tax=Rahnella perminowiae TaxID=2816244 RepID=UPI001C259F4C|nr:hypothetical protein [Rahnella perminowiae]MBU9812368.1 hypothetical protein [Rahnella perminowiae]